MKKVNYNGDTISLSENGYSMVFCWDGCCDIVVNSGAGDKKIHVCDLKSFIDWLIECREYGINAGFEV